jgi:hypothetical protein
MPSMHLTTLLTPAKKGPRRPGLRRRLEQFDNDLLLLCDCGENDADRDCRCA